MLDVQLFGVDAGAHHLSNLMLHLINTLLLFGIFTRATGFVWKSGFVAALFALHPLHVESVAWISERKDLLCTLFFLLSIRWYLGWVERPQLLRYLAVLVFFMIGPYGQTDGGHPPVCPSSPRFLAVGADRSGVERKGPGRGGGGENSPADFDGSVMHHDLPCPEPRRFHRRHRSFAAASADWKCRDRLRCLYGKNDLASEFGRPLPDPRTIALAHGGPDRLDTGGSVCSCIQTEGDGDPG